MPKLTEKQRCDRCGRDDFEYMGQYTKHTLHCDGTKPATSGRIDARSGSSTAAEVAKPEPIRRTPAAAKRHAKPTRVMQRRKTKSKRAVSRPGRPARRSPIQRKSVTAATAVAVDRGALVGARDILLTEMRTKRDLLNAAIAGLEALA